MFGLDESKLLALDQFLKKNNIFITGGAGTGKTFIIKVLQEAIDRLNLKCALTGSSWLKIATRGVAAHLIGGI